MSVLHFLYLYLLTIPIFFIIDIIWIGVFGNKFYQSQIGFLLGPINWPAAIIFYLIYIVGIIFFAVHPALLSGSLGKAVMLGALFGFFTYATYDFTNLATIKDWSLLVTIVDLAWGTFLSASVATVSYLIAKVLFF